MKKIFYYALAAVAAISITACADSHRHSHDDNHLHSHEAEHNHVHNADGSCASHSHEEHSHSHEAHSHSHDAHGHSHAEHSHSHEAGAKEEAHAHSHGAANVVTFSKELQQKIDFAVEAATTSSFNGAVKVAARVVAAPENESTVVATAAGRLHYVGNLVAGRAVSVKDALFVIDGSGVTENDAAVKYAAAESKYMFAKADYERKLSLYGNNIVSQKDLQAAEALLRESEAHYNSMKQTFNNGNLLLKADVDGFVATLLVENGEYVQAGTPLAVLQKEGGVNIEAELPIRYAQSLRNISSVNVELADGTVLSLDEINGNVLAVGRAANECNMIPVTVTAKHLPAVVGSVVTMHMAMALPHGGECVAVPRTALVEEMGNYFVFVQVCSEDFEKREVKIGNTDGKYTQILKGVHKGEKVVSKGAVSLKLSQSAGALDPHAGHVH